MPYIKSIEKVRLADPNRPMFGPGELNYKLTCLTLEYLEFHGVSYQILNDIVGALENCKLEFYRRVVLPYENKKIKQNGDVY